jgi:hypothetical protein
MSQIIMIVCFVQLEIERIEIISFLIVTLAAEFGTICESTRVQVVVWFSPRRLPEGVSVMSSSLKWHHLLAGIFGRVGMLECLIKYCQDLQPGRAILFMTSVCLHIGLSQTGRRNF